MKKIITMIGCLGLSINSSTFSISCSSPYKNWSTFKSYLNDSNTFLLYYHVKNDNGSINFDVDKNYSQVNSNTKLLDQNINRIYSDYSRNVDQENALEPGLLNTQDNYLLNGYGIKSNDNKIDIVDWSVDSSNDIWKEWWSKRIWAWVKSSLVQTYYYYTFEQRNQSSVKNWQISVDMIDDYLINTLTMPSSPIFLLVRGGKYVGFVTYHDNSSTVPDKNPSGITDYSTSENRIDDFSYYLDALFNNDDLTTTLITDINNSANKK